MFVNDSFSLLTILDASLNGRIPAAFFTNSRVSPEYIVTIITVDLHRLKLDENLN